MATTEQQAVTRDDALAFADEAFQNRDITFSHCDVVDMTAALGSFLSRHRLASVSSASAEGRSDDEVIAEFAFLYHAYGIESDDKLAPDALELKRKVLAAIASPEPVPATNQAGEVERKAIAAYLYACATEADRQSALFAGQDRSICDGCKQEAKAYRNAARMILDEDHASHRAALATQPATSQEGEGKYDHEGRCPGCGEHVADVRNCCGD